MTAFLERFFERYVSYDYTAELEEELDDVSGGRLGWQKLLERLLARLQAQGRRGDGAEAVGSHRGARRFPRALAVPRQARTAATRGCARRAATAGLACAAASIGAFVACSNYPECKYTQKFGQGGARRQASDGPAELGDGIELKSGRFGPYVERRRSKRASIPKDVPADGLTLEMAEKLLSLPREIGPHPETGKPISASIGRYGPYLVHDGKYARLSSTAEVFETGMNAAVVKLAEAAGERARARSGSREPIAVLGAHPESGKEIKVMAGRYGPYVTDGTTHATLPKSADPEGGDAGRSGRADRRQGGQGPVEEGRRKPARRGRKPRHDPHRAHPLAAWRGPAAAVLCERRRGGARCGRGRGS